MKNVEQDGTRWNNEHRHHYAFIEETFLQNLQKNLKQYLFLIFIKNNEMCFLAADSRLYPYAKWLTLNDTFILIFTEFKHICRK